MALAQGDLSLRSCMTFELLMDFPSVRVPGCDKKPHRIGRLGKGQLQEPHTAHLTAQEVTKYNNKQVRNLNITNNTEENDVLITHTKKRRVNFSQ